jgi:hypothetical protein
MLKKEVVGIQLDEVSTALHTVPLGLSLLSSMVSPSSPRLISSPTIIAVFLGGFDRILSGIDTTTCNDKVCSLLNSAGRGFVLLTEGVTRGSKINPRCKNDKILIIGFILDFIIERAESHKPHDSFRIAARQVNRQSSVVSSSETALGRHLSQDEEASLTAIGEGRISKNLSQGIDDAVAWKDAEVYDVGPLGDAQRAAVILLLDGAANVHEFTVFEDEEIVLLCKCRKAMNGFFAEVGDNIDMSLEDSDVRAEI